MSGVDDKIVSMQFDNEQFRRRIGDTLGDLDALTRKLNGVGSNSGLDELDKSANRFHLGNIGSQVEGVSTKFLAMATVGITALTNITNRAVSAGIAFGKSFTVAPIMDGFHEMETKVGSIQTILANTARFGTQLPEVTANLDKLNTYADKTIYSFGDMTRNIGLFTNAGIKVGDATSMIKGFSNEAAASGTSAEGAAGAAYQLSQALSAGQIRLMDWRSLTNVGMGNKNMQLSLIDIADKMGTLSKAGVKGSDVQKDFNASLEKGWLSADVMSTYLKIMAGDMSDAQIKALGFSDAQVQAFKTSQKTAEDAATKVRTFTQLVGTIKEAVGSGWAETFETVLGNFNDSTKLFTDINNSIGAFVQHSADARNNLLKGWVALGGRTELIDAFKDGLHAVGLVLHQVSDAFHTIFPPETAKGLKNLTDMFAKLMRMLTPSQHTLLGIHGIFLGLFSAISIVTKVLHELAWIVFNVFDSINKHLGGGSGKLLDFFSNIGVRVTQLNQMLTKTDAIANFFSKIRDFIYTPMKYIDMLGEKFDKLLGKFSVTSGLDAVSGATDRVSKRFDMLHEAINRLDQAWDRMQKVGDVILHALDRAWGVVQSWISELGHNMAAAMAPSDFNGVVDIVNVGLLGGIVLLFKKFLSGGLKLDFGGGVFGQIKDSLEQVTKTLGAMQAQLKAKALMEIAIALGVLTASIVVLSLIDSAALTKAMVAITVGFGELVGTMSALDKVIGSSKDASKMAIVAVALNLLASSMLILATAVKIMSTMSWEELVKGLGGVAIGLGIMVGAIELISTNPAGVISAGIAMVGMATAMTILGGAVKIFASMSWGDMAKGLVGVGAALGLIVLAMQFIPPVTILAAGLAMIPLATGMTILAGAVALFGVMSWEIMGKGLLGIAGALLIVAGAMNLMPLSLPITAAGMVILATALNIMAGAVALMGAMKIETLAKGIGAIAALLLVLTVAMNAMQGALVGAAALIVTAGALAILADVLTTIGKMSLKELAIGLGGIAAVLTVLGLAALIMEPVIPALMGLGIALALIGGGFALFGAGAYMVAKAFIVMSEAGKAGVAAILDAGVTLIEGLPKLTGALSESLVKSAGQFLQAGTTLLKIATVFLLQLLDTVIKLAPKIAQALVVIVTTGLALIRDKFPDLVATGLDMLINLLKGIRDNIDRVAQLAIDIIIRFMETLLANEDKLVNTGVDLLLGFLAAIAGRVNDVIEGGQNLLLSFLAGMVNYVYRIIDFAVSVVITFAQTIGGEVGRIVTAGADILIHFAQSLADNTYRVAAKGVDIVLAFLNAIGDQAIRLATGAADALTHFLNGLADAIRDKSEDLRKAGLNIAGAIIDGVTGGLASKAADIPEKIGGIFGKAIGAAKSVIDSHSPSRVFRDIALDMIAGTVLGIDQDTTAEASIVRHAEGIVSAFQETLKKMPHSLDGLDVNPVITPVLDLSQVRDQARNLDGLMAVSTIRPDVSTSQANSLSTANDRSAQVNETSGSNGPTEIKFEQNNYSPKALSTKDIYRKTRSQFAKAKEELNIP